MIIILGIVVALVAWALHLMQEAINHKEFAFMLAGFLVASSAAALIGVYFLMSTSLTYLVQIDHHNIQMLSDSELLTSAMSFDDLSSLEP